MGSSSELRTAEYWWRRFVEDGKSYGLCGTHRIRRRAWNRSSILIRRGQMKTSITARAVRTIAVMLISICPRRIGIDDRFHRRRGIRMRPVQPVTFPVFDKRRTGIQRSAAHHQPAIKTPQPIQPLIVCRRRRRDPRRRMPRQRLPQILRIGNVQTAIDHHLIPQPPAGIHPSDPHAAPGPLSSTDVSIPPNCAAFTTGTF